jgi:ABC-type phosphate/phosphonate transport system ATPase subunit
MEQVNTGYLALLSQGSNIAIIGNRGIGKTSLARQIQNMASGDNALLEKLGVRHEGKLDYF